MFDFVRKHTKVMQLLLFVLIVPSFVLFGLEGYSRFNDKGEVVAKVDGREVTQQEWDNAHKIEVDRIRSQMPNIDAKLLDSPQAKYGTLEKVVRERVLAAAAEKSQLVVPDQRVARELQRNELVQSLRGPDGKLDIERYRQVLQAQGMTPEIFESQIRRDLSTRQVLVGVGASAVAPAAQANVSLGSYFEKREVQLARFETAKFAAKVEPTDAEIEAYYKANPQLFQAPEQAAVEYVMLDLAAIQKGITLNEADLKTYYEQNAAQLASKEERRASHILLAAGKTASAGDKEKAKAKAAELLAQVRKNPASFAEVAKKESQDPGSAKQGGDLDFFARGAMTKPFEDAAFKLKEGEISDVVETEFGYHIIQVTDVKTPAQRTFEEMRPQLEADLKKQQAARKYAEAADTFSNTVYEQSDSLKPVADKLKLEIKSATNVLRTPAPGATGPLANPKFLTALFAPDSVDRKRNTEAVEVGPNQMVSGRISQYTPARARPLAEVKAQVREKLVAERAAELAKKEGQAKLAAWKAAAPAASEISEARPLSRQDVDKVPRPIIEAALRVDPASLPAFTGVDLGADGYAVLKINKVLPREAPVPAQAQAEQQQYLRAWASAEAVSYYNTLKDRYKAQILVAKPKDGVPAQ
ncbi:peptidyl-prolyl cis-trans isomerase [Caenimonas sedimenti]|uniref:Periplasmic chaperone PpiD n=1 Tax=Caenimonas sedimenti TaxID=2596921 RepID=A0A562ZWA9_9BURK|nr:SurA N-terminal domain-containing protein [Caenimonas sedimenti]TWO72651.1 peptidyl-prolyl cis-trans isomerase [Caenimonas sedimenti]